MSGILVEVDVQRGKSTKSLKEIAESIGKVKSAAEQSGASLDKMTAKSFKNTSDNLNKVNRGLKETGTVGAKSMSDLDSATTKLNRDLAVTTAVTDKVSSSFGKILGIASTLATVITGLAF